MSPGHPARPSAVSIAPQLGRISMASRQWLSGFGKERQALDITLPLTAEERERSRCVAGSSPAGAPLEPHSFLAEDLNDTTALQALWVGLRVGAEEMMRGMRFVVQVKASDS